MRSRNVVRVSGFSWKITKSTNNGYKIEVIEIYKNKKNDLEGCTVLQLLCKINELKIVFRHRNPRCKDA